jgi:hypothetical protein
VLASAEHRQQYDKRGLAALGGSEYKLLHDFIARGEARTVCNATFYSVHSRIVRANGHCTCKRAVAIVRLCWSSHAPKAAVTTRYPRGGLKGRAQAVACGSALGVALDKIVSGLDTCIVIMAAVHAQGAAAVIGEAGDDISTVLGLEFGEAVTGSACTVTTGAQGTCPDCKVRL